MAINIPATVNGATGVVTGFTNPTWSVTQSSATVPNGKLYTVTSKGGTQPSGVTVHSASSPFSWMVTQPSSLKVAPPINSAGVFSAPVGKNVYHISLWKGVSSAAGQLPQRMDVDIAIRVPAGADVADPDNISAALLAAFGAASQVVGGAVDTAKTGQA